MKLLLSAQGEIKSEAPIIIYHGGGGKERMKGGLHGFQGNRRGGRNSDCLQDTKGGGYKTLTANEGDH